MSTGSFPSPSGKAENGTLVEAVCRKTGVRQATLFRWKKVFGNVMPSEGHQLKRLQEENQHLRKLAADLTRDKEMPTEVIKKELSRQSDDAR